MSKKDLRDMKPEELASALNRAKVQGRKFITVKRSNECCKISGILTPRDNAGLMLGLGPIPGFEIEELLVTHHGRKETLETEEEGQRFSSILVSGYVGVLPADEYTVRIENVPSPFLDIGERLRLAVTESGMEGPELAVIMSELIAEHGLGHALLSKIRAAKSRPNPRSELENLLIQLQKVVDEKLKTVTPPAEDVIDFGAFKVNVPPSHGNN
jgi:hypothetical protein